MKYEFHVGDYVETRDGKVGHISACILISEGDYYTLFSFCVKGKRLKEIYAGEIIDLPKHFNRIGQYDFTKKDEGKIEPLDYTERFIRNSTVDTTLISYMKKINELVDAVNELRMRDAKESKDD